MKWTSLALLFVVGCAAPERAQQDGGVGGGGGAKDSGDDGDLAGSPDLAVTVDLSSPGSTDLAQVAADLSATPDLGTPPDLSPPPDQAHPADLSTCIPAVAGSPCDTSPQCGCTGGLNCSVNNYTTGMAACVAAGSTSNGFACTGSGAGQCTVGATCVDGVCQNYCESVADCGGQYHGCDQISNSSGTAIPGFKTCSQLCNPIKPDDATGSWQACGPGIGCLPGATGASSCYGPTKAGAKQGDDCSDNILNPQNPDFSKCAPGQLCLTTTIPPPFNLKIFSCAKFCRVALGDADCASLNSDAGTFACGSFSTKQYAGAQEIGVCN